MSQSTACGSLPVVVVTCQPTGNNQDGFEDGEVGQTLVEDVAHLAAPSVDDWVGRSSDSPVG